MNSLSGKCWREKAGLPNHQQVLSEAERFGEKSGSEIELRSSARRARAQAGSH